MSKNIAFIHLDLGIGGAEQLVVSQALALKKKGHTVTIFTSHHDPAHCFDETRDGTLQVVVYGDFLPRQILGSCHLLCSILRMVYVVLRMYFAKLTFDVVFNDQVSAINPLLFLVASKSIFYGHFPDLLLCTKRGSFLKRCYRWVLDKVEAKTTAAVDVVFVNSEFTRQTYRATFPSLHVPYEVLYPPVDVAATAAFLKTSVRATEFEELRGSLIEGTEPASRPFFFSLNRYERKKNIALAIHAYKTFLDAGDADAALVVAGGYDESVAENVEYYRELLNEIAQHGLGNRVLLLRNISLKLRKFLMREALACIYTPDNEHFGIVPIESMALRTPVIAVNSGGPTETVVDGITGYLCDNNPEAFADAMTKITERNRNERVKQALADACEKQAKRFGLDAFAERLHHAVTE